MRGARAVRVSFVCRIVFGGVCFLCGVRGRDCRVVFFARWGFVALGLGTCFGCYALLRRGCLVALGTSIGRVWFVASGSRRVFFVVLLRWLKRRGGRRIGFQRRVFLRAVEEGILLRGFGAAVFNFAALAPLCCVRGCCGAGPTVVWASPCLNPSGFLGKSHVGARSLILPGLGTVGF